MSFDFALINNDLKLLPGGDVRKVTDTPKLRQDILKIILTTMGSNKFHLWYGCTVGEDIIGRNLPENMMLSDVHASISQSLSRLKTLQQQQQSAQVVSLAELIHSIGGITVYRDQEDLRQIKIEIVVYSRNLVKIEEVFTLEA